MVLLLFIVFDGVFFKCKFIVNCCSKVLLLYWYIDWFKIFEELMFLILLNIFKNIVIEYGKDF